VGITLTLALVFQELPPDTSLLRDRIAPAEAGVNGKKVVVNGEMDLLGGSGWGDFTEAVGWFSKLAFSLIWVFLRN
jgi:hypothetical protein